MATVTTELKRMRVSAATNPKNVRGLLRAGVRTLVEWVLKGLVSAAGQERRSAEHPAAHPVPTPVPTPPPRPVATASTSVLYEDPPTLVLPRIPAAERFPIVWDADPVGLYVVEYERERALGMTR
ncbi:hypothetical protein B7755_018115 [Streptomyces sp. NBS 14/10]|uniref:hypothetical protein n=1 Tax=Streptomyces sp. NBS 14/10 TaxID=1945643 RepID=UPI00117CEA97|nr:hypothetical protein [Streptomyces sp. NBS 14/10]KAK1179887.1 hypothetical protein B7755_018115 [Streptomyces sp. NBS 14/10]